jgi:hypothetical protein
MTILPKPVSRRKKLPVKIITGKTVKFQKKGTNDIRTTPNKPYRTKRELSTPKSLQSYFILYLLFVRILNLSKDIVSFWHISNFVVRVRTCY